MKDPNGSENNDNKDKRHREKKDKFTNLVGLLVSKMLGDTGFKKRSWDKKIELVKKVLEKLDDPQFVLEWYGQLMKNKSSSSDVNKAGSEDHAFEIPESSHDYIPLQIKAQALKETKEESHSFLEELKQIMEFLEQKHQTFGEAKVYAIVANMLQKVVDSCANLVQCDILNQDCATEVQGHHGVKINGEQLRLSFPKNPNSILIKEKGKSAEIFDQDMIPAEKQGNEVILTFQLVAGKLTELKLDMKKINQETEIQTFSDLKIPTTLGLHFEDPLAEYMVNYSDLEMAQQMDPSFGNWVSSLNLIEFPMDLDVNNRFEHIEETTAQALKETKEESHSFLEELKQMMEFLEQQHQTFREAKAYAIVANMLQKVVDSCTNLVQCDILNQDCATEVQGHHGVKINGEQLRLSFPKNPNSILIKEKGKSAEIFDQEMIAAKKQGKEVIFTVQLVAGKLTELKVDMKKIDQEMMFLPAGNSGDDRDLESFLDPGLMDLLRDVTVRSHKQSYKMHPDNAELLEEIFQGHPEIDQNFQIAHPDLQSKFMEWLVEIYRKIKECKLEMLEMEDIESMYVKIQDMEKNGLQLTWLKDRFEKARKRLEREKKRRKIQERIKKDEEELAERIKKGKEEMAELDEEDS
ncbi:hypothetical protein PTKIN_Ptkin05aG0030300 [Pterospermum kingtungense]